MFKIIFELFKYDRNGRDKYGFDREGFDKYGFDRDGFSLSDWQYFNGRGINRVTKTYFDPNGCDKDGEHKDSGVLTRYDEDGWNKYGYDRWGNNKYKINGIELDNSVD